MPNRGSDLVISAYGGVAAVARRAVPNVDGNLAVVLKLHPTSTVAKNFAREVVGNVLLPIYNATVRASDFLEQARDLRAISA